MMPRYTLVLGVVLMAGPALAQQPAPMAPMPDMPPANTPGSDNMAAMQKMSRDMARVPMTGDPDRDFVTMMIPHHQGAIDMAKIEIRTGHDPRLKHMARQIVAAQVHEIERMKRWLTDHPVP